MSVPGYLSPTSGGSRLLRTVRRLGDPSLRVTSAGPGYLLVYDDAGRTEHPYAVDRAEVDAWASRRPGGEVIEGFDYSDFCSEVGVINDADVLRTLAADVGRPLVDIDGAVFGEVIDV
jgi:hypothetical protein